MTQRAAIVLRQSITRQGSESLDLQEGVCRAKAAELGVEVVMCVRDESVSAFKIHPMQRRKLKAVFEAGDGLDMMIYYRQSRCFRRTLPDFSDVVMWATKHDVLLVSATENFGDPRKHAELLVPLITSWTDQGDSETKSQIFTDLKAKYRREGRWAGGKIPYGYRSVETAPKRHDLAVDEVAAAIVREAVCRVLRGESLNSICADFNRRGVASPMNRLRQLCGGKLRFYDDGSGTRWTLARWTRQSLKIILLSPATIGHAMHGNREIIRDEGSPSVIAPPLIPEKEWERVKLALGDHRTPRRSKDASLLLRVAYCMDGLPLYRFSSNPHGKIYTYYKCLALCRPDRYPDGCTSAAIPMGFLDDLATGLFLAEVGDVEVMRQVVEADDSHKRRLNVLGKRIIALTAEEVEHDKDHDEEIARLKAERARLRVLKVPGPRVREESTGRTFAQEWEARDVTGRRDLMVKAGFRVEAGFVNGNLAVMHVLDPELAKRAGKAASGQQVTIPADDFAVFRKDAAAVMAAAAKRAGIKGRMRIPPGHGAGVPPGIKP